MILFGHYTIQNNNNAIILYTAGFSIYIQPHCEDGSSPSPSLSTFEICNFIYIFWTFVSFFTSYLIERTALLNKKKVK